MIGSLGDTVFTVTPEQILTLSNGTARSTSSRWSQKEVHLALPVQEFLGPDLSALSITINLDELRGVFPLDEINRMRESCLAGEVLPFLLGDELIGDYVVQSVNDTWTRINPNGKVAAANVALSLREYN